MYIDPNTGGMLFQILAASLALISGFLLLFSGKIRASIARFRRARRGETQNEAGEQSSTFEASPTPTESSKDSGSHN